MMPSPVTTDSRRRPVRNRAAFTLIELVVVIAIMGVMAAIAIPRYANSIARRRVELAAQRVVEDLALARQQAIATSSSWTVTFLGGSERVRINGLAPLDPGGAQYITELSLPPFEVNMRDIDFGGDNKVVFDGFGSPDSGGQLTIRLNKIDRYVVLDPDTGLAEVVAP